ncbi:hypothetical protein BGX28_008937 [Mortierella sp. GBA30]|nr:hypothetical protein BGX28_008937 [Mortierella sp. GBA30]
MEPVHPLSSSEASTVSVYIDDVTDLCFLWLEDDYDVIGTLPGFEKLVEAESSKHSKGKLRAIETVLLEDDEYKDHKPIKKKRIDKDDRELEDIAVKPSSAKSKGWRKKSVSLEPTVRTDHMATTTTTPSSPPSATSSTGEHRVRTKQTPGEGSKSSPGVWPQFSLSIVRIEPRTEFSSVGLSVQFGTDRLALTIKRKCTKIPYSNIKLLEYYTASPVRIIRLSLNGKLEESSFLAPYYNTAAGEARRIILFTDARPSHLSDICAGVKQRGVDAKSLTEEAAERLLAGNSKRTPPSTITEHAGETLFVYPLNNTAKSKSIAVRAEDVSRLEDGEFLNDTLIEFGLKYAHANVELKNAVLANQIYIFNTFFYQRLNAKPAKGATSSYGAVKNWTAKVDLFSMKYIVVPIHENLHWYLAIITNPGLLLKYALSKSPKSEVESSSAAACESPIDEAESKLPMETESMEVDKDGQRQTVFDLDVDMEPKTPTDGKDVSIEKKKLVQKSNSHINAEEKTYILCLDSLGGTHQTVFKVLRSFLQQELLSRKGIDMPLTTKEVTGKYSSKCPRQENLWDCGIYLLHYTEVFMRNPGVIVDAVVNKTDDKALWVSTELATKREKYRDIILSLQERYKAYQISLELIEDFKQSKENKEEDKNKGKGKDKDNVENKDPNKPQVLPPDETK